MIKPHFILYVADQEKSCSFYRKVLGMEPGLDVPGMTEFAIGESAILGLMPTSGIKRLLGSQLPDPHLGAGIGRAELYLIVENPQLYYDRALQAGAVSLSPLSVRDWGDRAAYCLDPDGYVVAFAERNDDLSA